MKIQFFTKKLINKSDIFPDKPEIEIQKKNQKIFPKNYFLKKNLINKSVIFPDKIIFQKCDFFDFFDFSIFLICFKIPDFPDKNIFQKKIFEKILSIFSIFLKTKNKIPYCFPHNRKFSKKIQRGGSLKKFFKMLNPLDFSTKRDF